jgi:flavin-dependent dehydrogenase
MLAVSGAEIREQTKVTDVNLSEPDVVTVKSAGGYRIEQVHKARFLIDASGRDAFVHRSMVGASHAPNSTGPRSGRTGRG